MDKIENLYCEKLKIQQILCETVKQLFDPYLSTQQLLLCSHQKSLDIGAQTMPSSKSRMNQSKMLQTPKQV